MVICTACTGSCKSNYNAIMTAPQIFKDINKIYIGFQIAEAVDSYYSTKLADILLNLDPWSVIYITGIILS